MNTSPRECCEKCEIWDRNSPNFDPPRSEGYVWNGTKLGIHDCPCHSNSTQEKCSGIHCRCMDIGGQCPNMHWYHCKEHNPNAYQKGGPAPQHTSPSDFFRKPPEEKEETMLKVAMDATNDQREQIGLPPLHTSPENPSEKPNSSSFTEKTLEEFRELIHGYHGNDTSVEIREDEFFYRRAELEQWLTTKLEKAEYIEKNGAELEKMAVERWREEERSRILALIESKKIDTDHVVIGRWESARDEKIRILAHNAALTSLAAELQDFRSEND